MAKNITSLQHPLVKHLVRLRQNRDYREEHNSVLIEGRKMIAEANGLHSIKLLVAYDSSYIPSGINADEIVFVPESVMQKISGVLSPDGLIAELELPKPASLNGLSWILAFDGVSDPGNLGTLLRTGLALGWEGAFILENSCDPYNDKAIRAAKGATFKFPIASGNWNNLMEVIENNHLVPFAADMGGISIEETGQLDKVLLVLGNEAHGVSQEIREACKSISVPMRGDMESLNVAIAGGILMYLMRNKSTERL